MLLAIAGRPAVRSGVVFALMLTVAIPAFAQGGGQNGAGLTLPAARAMALAAEAQARANGTQVVVSVLDAGGQPLLLERMPGAQLASLQLAEKKARSAVYYQRPSQAFETALAGGKQAVLALPDALPAAGGIPLYDHQQLIGAIGVSGGNNARDEQAAQAGVRAMSAP